MSPNKMERFTQRARRVLSLAQEEAERLHHNYIGTEHLLLGLMREEGGVAGRVLRDLGLEQRQVEKTVAELTRASERSTTIALDLSPGTKRVLELAVDEARRMGHHYIGTEHLLLGLVRQSEGVAVDVLKHLGITPEEVRRQVRRILQEQPIQPPTAGTPATGISALKPPAVTIPSVSFHILQDTIQKVLGMVQAHTLTSSQAAEILSALYPYFAPTTGEKVKLVGLFNQVEFSDQRQLHMHVTDKKTGAMQFDMVVPLPVLLGGLETIASAIADGSTGTIWTDESDAKNRMEVSIEEAGK
jgi:hypothetical protein